ncbi:methyl-accepting chemotaxis protein [Metabacillus malikii]|uniref:Methyl-accepting chemotaxis protein n=1 Tax=Metabacillus malikii TaxID=1504265 RepID=A0ABT9ZIC8_9BACI|nr:methyl-accepting chemotaxis protein [Metabacillus malikii]MDQ0232028.1 methyl-accepting chemotaxis protein [Metabacillus malikii]
MKIKTKLLIIVTILILTIIGLGIFSGAVIESTNKQNELLKNQMETQKLVKHVQYRIAGLSNDERAFIITGDDEYTTGMEEKAKDIEKTIEDIQKIVESPKLIEAVATLSQDFELFWEMNQNVISTYEADPDAAKSLHFNEERTLRKEVLDPAVNAVVSDIDQSVQHLITENEANAKTNNLILLLTTIISSVVGVMLSILLLKSILGPLHMLNKQMDDIANGEADLTKRVEFKGKNEFGQLANSFNRFVDSLRAMIVQIGVSSTHVASSAEQLSASTIQSEESTRQVSSTMQAIAASSEVHHSLTESSRNAVQASLQNLADVANNSNHVADISNTMNKKAENGTNLVKKLVDHIETVHQSVELAIQGVQSFVTSAAEIKDMSKLITDISSQTNLLALNAAIEASRAGEQGKGFAVVAEEIRKLADETNVSASKIENLVATIQQDSSETVQTIGFVKENVSSSLEFSELTVREFQAIMTAIEQVTSQVQEVAAMTQQITSDFEATDKAMEEMSKGSRETLASTENVAAATEEQLASIEEVAKTTSTLSELATDLEAIVGRFKVS